MTAGSPPSDPPPDLSGDWHLDAEPASGDAPEAPSSTEPLPPIDSSNPLPTTHYPPPTDDVPPSPEQLIEAMLFVGGHPLSPAVACAAVRGLTPERFLVAVDALARRYRRQRRPYSIQSRDDGVVLTILPSQ